MAAVFLWAVRGVCCASDAPLTGVLCAGDSRCLSDGGGAERYRGCTAAQRPVTWPQRVWLHAHRHARADTHVLHYSREGVHTFHFQSFVPAQNFTEITPFKAEKPATIRPFLINLTLKMKHCTRHSCAGAPTQTGQFNVPDCIYC